MTTNRLGDLVVQPVSRERAAAPIVEQLAALILRGELREGEALPSERILAERFRVARGTVRQAIHKLADWGLVETRQGGVTRITNVDEAYSVEVTELRYRLGPVDERERDEWIERRMLQGVSIVTLAELNVDTAILDALEPSLARLESVEQPEAIWASEAEIWTALARMTQNRLFLREVQWFFRNVARAKGSEPPTKMSPAVRYSFYRELFRRLRTGESPALYYLQMVQLLLRSSPSRAR